MNFKEKNPKFSDYKNIFVFDFETSGLDFENDRVIELGGLLLTKNSQGIFEEKETIDKLVKINKPLSEKIVELTGINDQMLEKEGVDEEEIFNDLKRMSQLDKTLFLAYNIQFDITFLLNMFKRHDENLKFENDILDVMAMYKDFYGYPHRLDSLVENLNIQHKNTHRASDDCFATYLGFIELIKRVNGGYVDPYINNIGFNPKYGVNGIKLNYVNYVAQFGGRQEIIKKAL